MSSDGIIIDDSSAMASNLVAAVEGISNAVSSSSVSFNASFDSLAKEFQTGNLKIVDAIKVMQSDLSKALNDVKINITNNYKLAQEAKKKTKKTPSTDEEKMAKLAKGLGDVFAVTFGQVESIKKSTKKGKGKGTASTALDFGSAYASQSDVSEKLMSSVASGFGEVFSATEKQMTAMSKSTKDKKGKKYEMPSIGAEYLPKQEVIEPKASSIETFALKTEEASSGFAVQLAKFREFGNAIENLTYSMNVLKSGIPESYGLAGNAAEISKPITDIYAALEPIYGVSDEANNRFADLTKTVNPLIDTFSLMEEKIQDLSSELRQCELELLNFAEVGQYPEGISSYESELMNFAIRFKDLANVFDVAQNQTQQESESSQKYRGGESYSLEGSKTKFVGPKNITEDQRNAIEASKAIPGSDVGPMPKPPSYMSQFNQNLTGGAKFFGNALSPIFQGIAQKFGKNVSPFLANPIAKAGMNLAQGGMQYAQTGNLGIAGGRASAAIGGGATAALGVGLAGFGVALSAVTGAVTIAGQAIQSMSSYVAKFSPAAAERMNLVFNDLQGVIGKALLPVFEMAIPIVRQFADFVHSAMQALAPSISIVRESFAEIVPPLIELGAVLIDAFMPVIKFAAGLIYGLTQILVPLINGFSALFETASMMAEIFSGGISITDIMINGFKLLGDITNIVVGAFNWMVAAFYAGTGSILKFASWLIDWVDGVGQGETSKALEKMGNSVIDGATKLEDAAERQMKAGLEGKKFEYKAGEIKGKGGIKSGSSVGMAVREAQSMSIESLGDAIRKAAITAQAPEQKDRQEEYMKTVSENTAYDKQKKAMLDAIKESGLVDGNETPFWDSLTEMDTDYSGGGGSFAPNGVA